MTAAMEGKALDEDMEDDEATKDVHPLVQALRRARRRLGHWTGQVGQADRAGLHSTTAGVGRNKADEAEEQRATCVHRLFLGPAVGEAGRRVQCR